MLSSESRKRLLGYVCSRFGMDVRSFEPYDILAFSRQAFLFRHQDSGIGWAGGVFARCGLPFLRQTAGYLKPTTVFAQRFGRLATRNLLCLSLQEISALCRRGEITVPEAGMSSTLAEGPGYVIIRFGQHVVGVGLLMEGGRLLCRFPRAIREALAAKAPSGPGDCLCHPLGCKDQ